MEWGKKLGGVTLGKLATLWDGEVCGGRGSIEDSSRVSNALILSDLQAAIAAVKQASHTEKARTLDLKIVMEG